MTGWLVLRAVIPQSPVTIDIIELTPPETLVHDFLFTVGIYEPKFTKFKPKNQKFGLVTNLVKFRAFC